MLTTFLVGYEDSDSSLLSRQKIYQEDKTGSTQDTFELSLA